MPLPSTAETVNPRLSCPLTASDVHRARADMSKWLEKVAKATSRIPDKYALLRKMLDRNPEVWGRVPTWYSS
jgi:hypothetical protein